MRARVLLIGALVGCATAQFGTHPPPPPPAAACLYPVPGYPKIKYDLTPFQLHSGDITVQGKDAKFWVQVCQQPQRRCDTTTCNDCTCDDPSGTATWTKTAGSYDTCGAIGSEATAQWSLQDPSDPNGGVQISYTNGDPALDATTHQMQPRSSVIKFKCGGGGPHGVSAKEDPPLHYQIVLGGDAACAIGPKPLSWGWWTVIFTGVAFVGYFGGGSFYNRRQGQEGLDAIPQWAYWQQLPGLLKDGNHFFWVEGRVAMRQGRRGFRDWWENRNTKELKAPLAASPES
jgi:hypothetical protein